MLVNSTVARRRGLTLTEALVAMFVAAIGMISLLALFPLGALQMGQALKDARCTETATKAEALMRTHWRIEVIEKSIDSGLASAINTGSGDPLFLDPIGRTSGAAGPIAGIASLTRANLGATGTLAPAFRFCSLLDDMTFEPNGAPKLTGGLVERTGRYNWTAVLQRPMSRLANVANLTILVFDARAPGYVAPNSELVYDPSGPSTRRVAIAGPSTLRLNFPAADVRPAVGKGRWIALYTQANHLLTFHRVVSLGEDGSTPTIAQFDLELQTPIPVDTIAPFGDDPAAHDPNTCRAIVFAGLAEVFERDLLTAH